MKFKRIACIFTAAVILFTATACGGDAEATPPPQTQAPTEAATETPTETPTEAPTEAPTETPDETPTEKTDPTPEPAEGEGKDPQGYKIPRNAEEDTDHDFEIDPFAFFVGRVVQSVSNEPSNVETADLSQYIDRENKTIESQTGELFWDYSEGIVKYDSEYFQGALGFYQDMDIELQNVTIRSGSDYITIACVPLDGKPIAESDKILIQAMTDSQFKYYATNETEIISVGRSTLTVADIGGNLMFKDIKASHITRLDPNGYIYAREVDSDISDGVEVELHKDSIYTILSTEALEGTEVPYEEKEGWMGYWDFVVENDTFSDSHMDLSYLNEDIAGEKGFVSKDGDNFVLGDGTPVDFWAVNAGLAVVNRPKEEVDYIAKRLAKSGVNMIRIHGAVTVTGDPNGTMYEYYEITEETLDNYHYFVYAMKQEGIYTKLSYYFPLWVNMQDSFGFPGYTGEFEGAHPFTLLQFNKDFQDVYKSWAEKILLTVNPYTGVPLAQEPAVAMIEVQNEDNYFFWTFKRSGIPEPQMNILEDIYNEHLINIYGSREAVAEAWQNHRYDHDTTERFALMDAWFITTDALTSEPAKKRAADQLRFFTEHQHMFYSEMYEYYRSEIGTPILITASNWTTAEPRTMEALERYTYTATDVIDRHGYFEEGHTGTTAGYRVDPGHTYVDISATLNPSKAIMQSNAIKGYPFIITETAWPRPNRYYGEAVPMWALYGALQGVDGVFMFALGYLPWEENTAAKWPIATPSVIGQFPAFALMYRLGYIKEADIVVDASHNLEELYNQKGADIYEGLAIDNIRR